MRDDRKLVRGRRVQSTSDLWPRVAGAGNASVGRMPDEHLAALGRGGARCRAVRTIAWPGLEGGGDGRDGVLCGGHANIGGQRMTGPQRRPASLRAFQEPGPVKRWPGNRLSRRFLRSGAQWSRREALRPALEGSAVLVLAARWWEREGAGPTGA